MRIDYAKEFPSGFEAMLSLEQAVRSSELEPILLGSSNSVPPS
jgi:hypothetical protein